MALDVTSVSGARDKIHIRAKAPKLSLRSFLRWLPETSPLDLWPVLSISYGRAFQFVLRDQV